MAGFTLTVPKQYRARLGGEYGTPLKISIEAKNEGAARSKLVDYGIPYAATNSFGVEPQASSYYRYDQDSTALSSIKKKGGPSLVDSGVVGGGSIGANTGTFKNMGEEGSVFNDSVEQGGQSQFSPISNYKPKTAADFRQILLQAKNKRTQDASRARQLANQAQMFANESDTTRSSASDIDDIVASQGTNLGGKGDGGIVEDIDEIEPEYEITDTTASSKPDWVDSDDPRNIYKDTLKGPTNFEKLIFDINSGEIPLFSGGTFDLSPMEDVEFWNAIFELPSAGRQFTRSEMMEQGFDPEKFVGDEQQLQLEVMAKQLIKSAPNSFEAEKALKEFYDLTAMQLDSRGVGKLNTTSGRTIAQFVTQNQTKNEIDSLTNSYETNPDVFNTDLDQQLSNIKEKTSNLSTGFDPSTFDYNIGKAGGETDAFDVTGAGGANTNGASDTGSDPSTLNYNTGEELTPFNPNANTGQAGQSGQIAIQDIINSFEQLNPGQTTTYQLPMLDGEGVVIPGRFTTVVNPLLESLLDSAELNNGYVNQATLSAAQNTTAVAVAQLQKDEAVAVAYQQGVSAADIATIQQNGDYNIAVAQQIVDKHIANQQLVGTQAQAAATATAAASMATGQTGAAFLQGAAQIGAAESAAGAASPFGFMQQATTNDALQTPEQQLKAIYDQLNSVGLAQAGAANIGAQDNAFSFAAGQAINPVTGELQFDPNQIAQISANSAEAVAARGQAEAAQIQGAAQQAIAQIQSSVGLDQNNKEYQIAQIVDQTQRAVAAIQSGAQQGVAQTQSGGQLSAAQTAAGAASPYGFLQQGGTTSQLNQIFAGQNAVGMAQANPYGQTAVDRQKLQETQFNPYALTNAQGYGLGQAQAANNPYAATQLGQDSTRIDQILRGGLSPEQRIAEINASQSGQNFANQLNFISNPSAVGFATEQGLFGGGNNQVLQDINNSPEGMIPGSTFGFNSPTAAGAGGGQTTTANTDNFNPTANTFRNASDEQIGFIQGAVSAGGQSPSEFGAGVQSVTPKGY